MIAMLLLNLADLLQGEVSCDISKVSAGRVGAPARCEFMFKLND
jgi:hypothetical protein